MSDFVYHLGQKVLVYQGPLLYHAKVVKTYNPVNQIVNFFDEKHNETAQQPPGKKFPKKLMSDSCYLIHYQGWNSKWDEWVLRERILELNNENLALKDTLENSVNEEETKKEELSKPKPGTKIKINSKTKDSKDKEVANKLTKGEDDILKFKKRKVNITEPKKDTNHYESKKGFTHYEIKVLVPDELKLILVDDWEQITKNNKLIHLPSECSVYKVLKDYSSDIIQSLEDDNLLHTYLEIVESLKLYFNKALGNFILYRYEREQYKDIINEYDDLDFVDIYSPIFLLRLLSILPNLLIQNDIDIQTIQIMKKFLDRFCKWFSDHKKEYLIEEYENKSPSVALLHG